MSFLQSLASAFKGGGRERVPLARSFTSPWSFALEPRPFEYRSAVARAFVENPVAQRAVRLVAEGVGSAPLVPADEATVALVSATSAGQSLLETLAAQILLHGNGYVQIVRDGGGTPVELFALRPDRVAVVAGEDGWPAGYKYTVGDKVMTLPVEDRDGWPALVHLKAFHPADDHYGAGCLAAANQAVAIHNAASAWNRALLENAARPSGALVMDQGDGMGLSGDQFDRLKAELEAAFQGAGNAGRPMLLEGGLRWQPLSLSPADMDFAGLKAAAARDIALAFGVPPMLLGRPGRASDISANGGGPQHRRRRPGAPWSIPRRAPPLRTLLPHWWLADFSRKANRSHRQVRSLGERTHPENAMIRASRILLPLVAVLPVCQTLDQAPATRLGEATLLRADGTPGGTAQLLATGAQVEIAITVTGVPGGVHGAHLHTTGSCGTADFSSAGGHLNPAGRQHGSENPAGAHLGDLPNITVGAEETGTVRATLSGSRDEVLARIFDADGTAVVVHAGPDDYRTDPSGNSGSRIACGVLTRT
jgi:HK97 family phage portal protein